MDRKMQSTLRGAPRYRRGRDEIVAKAEWIPGGYAGTQIVRTGSKTKRETERWRDTTGSVTARPHVAWYDARAYAQNRCTHLFLLAPRKVHSRLFALQFWHGPSSEPFSPVGRVHLHLRRRDESGCWHRRS